jgi:hypothetical protein
MFLGISGGRFVVTESFVAFIRRLLLDMDEVTGEAGCEIEGWSLQARGHERKAVGAEGKINNMIGTFGDLEEAPRNMEQVIPELRVSRHETHESIEWRFVIREKIVHLAGGVIDKTNLA